jgi:hypothetical protein
MRTLFKWFNGASLAAYRVIRKAIIIVADPDHIITLLSVNFGFIRNLKTKIIMKKDSKTANDPPIILNFKYILPGSNNILKNCMVIIKIKGENMWIVSFNLLNMLVNNIIPKTNRTKNDTN